MEWLNMAMHQRRSKKSNARPSLHRLGAFFIPLGVIVLALCISGTIAAYGHAAPVSYSIEPNAVFEDPGSVPTSLVMSFSERPDPKTSYIHVLNSRNERIDNNDFSITSQNGREATVTLDPAKLDNDSIYSVSWRTFSLDDGHITEGAFVFGVGNIGDISSVGGGASEQTRYVTSTTDALLRWPLIVAQTAVVGGALAHMYLWKRPVMRKNDDSQTFKEAQKTGAVTRKLALIFVASAATIAAFGTALVFVQASYLVTAENSDSLSIFQSLVSGSPTGLVWMLRIATSAAIIVVSVGYYVMAKRNANLRSLPFLAVILVAGAVSMFSNSMLSHNSASPFLPEVAIFSDWLHFMAVSVWVGGLFYFSTVGAATIRGLSGNTLEQHRQLSLVLPRFSILAAISLGVIGITGIYMAWIHIHDFELLFGTTYGTNLIIKLLAAAPMVALGGYHQLVLHRNMVLLAASGGRHAAQSTKSERSRGNVALKFTKTVRIESIIGIGVLLAAAFLTITSPPAQEHHPADGPGSGLVQSATVDNVDITLEISPFQVGVNRFEVLLKSPDGQAPTNIQAVFMRLTNTEARVGPIIVTLDKVSDGSFSTTGAFFSQPGTWRTDLIVQRTDAYDLNHSFEQTLVAASVSGDESHSGHEQPAQETPQEGPNVGEEETYIPPSESFTITAIILSIGVAASSAYFVIKGRRQLRRTVSSLGTV